MIVYQSPESHDFSPVKIAFLTGLSYPNTCQLSKVQRTFLSRLECCESWKVYQNFPYVNYVNQAVYLQQSTSFVPEILTTSIANIKQYFAASSPRYRSEARKHLEQLAASTEHLFLLVGSCGLEILNHALTPEVSQKLRHVFAFGPVAKALPDGSHTLLQGSGDYVSKVFFRNVDSIVPNLRHLGYLENEEVFQQINQGLKYEVSKLKER